MEQTPPKCSFCGKSQMAVRKLIGSQSNDAYICDECIDLCNEIIIEEIAEQEVPNWWPWRSI